MKLMIIPEFTKIKQRNGMIRIFEEGISGRRSGPVIQLQIEIVYRKA